MSTPFCTDAFCRVWAVPAPAAALLLERVSGVLRSWFSSWYSGNGNFSCLSKFLILIKQNEIPTGMFPVRKRRSRSIPCCVCLPCFSGQDFSCQQHALKGDAILKGWILGPVPKSAIPSSLWHTGQPLRPHWWRQAVDIALRKERPIRRKAETNPLSSTVLQTECCVGILPAPNSGCLGFCGIAPLAWSQSSPSLCL